MTKVNSMNYMQNILIVGSFLLNTFLRHNEDFISLTLLWKHDGKLVSLGLGMRDQCGKNIPKYSGGIVWGSFHLEKNTAQHSLKIEQ